MRNEIYFHRFLNSVLLTIFFNFLFSAVLEDPEFTEIIENITVPAGRNVKLACSVKDLGSYKVSFKKIALKNNRKRNKYIFSIKYKIYIEVRLVADGKLKQNKVIRGLVSLE